MIGIRNQIRLLNHLYRSGRAAIRNRIAAGVPIEPGIHHAEFSGSKLLILCILFICGPFLTSPLYPRQRGDKRLQTVVAVFVSGNNQAAEKARETLRSEKTCLRLAPNAAESDAVLEIALESQSQGGILGGFGGRASIASGTLALKSGDLIWSRSYRFSDAPFRSGGKVAGNLLVRRLAKEAGCKQRFK